MKRNHVTMSPERAAELLELYNSLPRKLAHKKKCKAIATSMGAKLNTVIYWMWQARKVAGVKMLKEMSPPLPEVPKEIDVDAILEEEEEEEADPIAVRTLKIKNSDQKSYIKSLEERLVKAESLREELFNLGPLKVSKLEAPTQSKTHGRRTVILHISDIQYGEVIDPEAIDYVNSYNIEIANKRIRRYFQKCWRFLTELWQGEKVDEIVVLLNGDMVSGALHNELDRTDEARPMMATKMVAEQLVAGLQLLRDIGVRIRIISTVGNHGRTTMKPESKSHALQSYDALVAMFVEMAFKGDPLVSVHYSKSIDALFSIYGFPMLVTHGDRIGSRGGMGFQGATATILRGQQKVFMDYALRGIHLYKIFTGHFHTPASTVWGYANNTMAGVSEYARDGRMTPTPAAQSYFVVHEKLGVIEAREIMVGALEEGTSHRPAPKNYGTALDAIRASYGSPDDVRDAA